MNPRFKLALASLLALGLGALGTWLLTGDRGAVEPELRRLDDGPGEGVPFDPLGGGPGAPGAAADGTRPVMEGPEGRPLRPGGGSLVGARAPHGIDLSDPATRAAELARLLGAIEVDWAAVAEILALMPAGERLDAASADALLAGLRSERRNMALLAFARLADGALVPALFDLYGDPTAPPGARAAALRALWEMPGADGAAVVRGLESLLRGRPEEDRELLYAIARRGGAEGARALLEYLGRTPDLTRIPDHVLQQLDLGRSVEAREALKAALAAPQSPQMAEKLLAIVAYQQAQGLTEQVIAFDSDAHPAALRRQALDALRQIGDRAAVEHLLGLARQPGEYGEIALKAVADLRRADAAARQALVKALDEAGLAARPDALRAGLLLALGSVEHSPAVPVVAEYLKHPHPELRSAAVRSLGRMGNRARDKVGALVALWDGADETLRRDLAIAVSSIGGESAVGALTRWVAEEGLPAGLQRTLHVGLRAAREGGVPPPR